MQAPVHPVLRDIVLVGGGHSHVGVLRHFGMHPLPGVRLTLVCTDPHTPYSGMLPGYVAGHYSYDDVHIDLGRLAAFAGARFICGEVTGIDRANCLVALAGRPPVHFDCVSINTGSTVDGNAIPIGKTDADEAMDYASCIGCGACVAACPNASAMLFTGAKVSHLVKLPQGEVERGGRVRNMVAQMDAEGFGTCTNHGECSASCPKEIPFDAIVMLNREFMRASVLGKS